MSRLERAWKIWRAFWQMDGSRSFGVLLGIFVIVVVGSVWLLSACYVDPVTGNPIGTAQAAHAVFIMLTFNSTLALPQQWYTAAVFFIVPLLGLLVLGHGLVRLGRALFDRHAWEAAMASSYRDHVIVCGLGKVGYRVVRWLHRLGEPVVGLELNPDRSFAAKLRRLKVPVVVGDARDPVILEQVGIADASAIVPCADDDLTNLAIALEARGLHQGIKVVLRLFDDRLAKSVKHGFDINTAFSTSALSAPAFAAAATRVPVEYAFSFGGAEEAASALLTISKFTVAEHSPLVGTTVAKLEQEFQVAVLMHKHGENTQIHPTGDAVFAADDGFVVSAEIEAIRRLAELTPLTPEMEQQPDPETDPP